MQLNVYVPKEKAHIAQALDEAAKRTGRQKNELVLEAIEAFLGQMRPQLGTFSLGDVDLPPRGELYLERWTR